MQEEVESRTLTLAVSGTKFTARLLKAAISKYLAHRSANKRSGAVKHQGKQTVKQLIRQNQGVVSEELTDPNMRAFNRIARKHGVDYAVKRVRGSEPPKFLIFFKGRDTAAISEAFREYASSQISKASRPSVLQKLADLGAKVKLPVKPKVKHKEQSL